MARSVTVVSLRRLSLLLALLVLSARLILPVAAIIAFPSFLLLALCLPIAALILLLAAILSSCSFKKGDYTQAEAWALKGLGILEKSFSPEHPRLIELLVNLSAIYRAIGNMEQALAKREIACELSSTLYKKRGVKRTTRRSTCKMEIQRFQLACEQKPVQITGFETVPIGITKTNCSGCSHAS